MTMTARQRTLAACRTLDPELFFPVGNSGPALAQAEKAKAVCHLCPVEAACLEEAIERAIEFGVWGGMSERERREHRRRQGSAHTRPVEDVVHVLATQSQR